MGNRIRLCGLQIYKLNGEVQFQEFVVCGLPVRLIKSTYIKAEYGILGVASKESCLIEFYAVGQVSV